jgi:hypothetical protein
VVLHVRSYNQGKTKKDATVLRRGGSRFEINSNKREAPRSKRVASERISIVFL